MVQEDSASGHYSTQRPRFIRQRHARLKRAFSKKLENHISAFAHHTKYHKFVKISGAHKMSPAQAAGIDSRVWGIEDMVAMIEAWEMMQVVGEDNGERGGGAACR